jgi:hypothetical protein
MFTNGGWFANNLQVQVYQNSSWVNVPNTTITPTYPYSSAVGTQTTYTIDFPPTWGTGIRIIGTPGGTSHFTSIGQLGVYYGGRNLVADSGFEAQNSSTVLSPWTTEGPDSHTIDVAGGVSHSGLNNGFIRSSSRAWNAFTQSIAVQPNTNYTLTGWVQNDFTTGQGSFGVRLANGTTILKQVSFGAAATYIPLTVTFNSANNSSLSVFTGFVGQNTDLWMRVDDIYLR